jgi:hypothetical protein
MRAGAELRAIRQQLGFSMREVHAASVVLAKSHRQSCVCDSFQPSAQHRKQKQDSQHSPRLYALAPIYRRTMNEFLLYTNLFGFQNSGDSLSQK